MAHLTCNLLEKQRKYPENLLVNLLLVVRSQVILILAKRGISISFDLQDGLESVECPVHESHLCVTDRPF